MTDTLSVPALVMPPEEPERGRSLIKSAHDVTLTEAAELPERTFRRSVAFDTFHNKDASDFSLTLKAKHKDYKYGRLTRTFLIGVDNNKYSESALEWMMENLIEDGDDIVCLRGIDPAAKSSISDQTIEEKLYIEEAKTFLKHILRKNVLNKEISVILEFALGKVQDLIQKMIQVYEPSILIVGTRGRSMDGFKGLLPGSISKYCLQHSPIPCVVVRPSQKRQKKKAKREADPTRQSYRDLLMDSQDRTVIEKGCTDKDFMPNLPSCLLPSSPKTSLSPSLQPSKSREGSTSLIGRSRSPFSRLSVDFGKALRPEFSKSSANISASTLKP